MATTLANVLTHDSGAVTGVTVYINEIGTITFEPSTVETLRCLMAHLGEDQTTAQEKLVRLAVPQFQRLYLALREIGLMLGPDLQELRAYHEAAHTGNQVKLPPNIELTVLGYKLNQVGKVLYQQATMTSEDYAVQFAHEAMQETE